MGSITQFEASLDSSRTDGDCNDNDNDNAILANELRGQKMHVNMKKSFPDWPQGGKNLHYDRLHVEVDQLLERVISDPQRCQGFKKSDFALFCCLWWPDTDWEHLYTAMLFTVWAFVWDDTIDTNEDSLAHDFQKACVFRDQSLAYVRHCLRLSSQKEEPACPNKVCSIFKDFTMRYCIAFENDQRQRLFDMIHQFFQHSEMEQKERLENHLPNYDEYLEIRYGVTGVHMFSLLLEITFQMKLPSWVVDSPERKAIVKECNMIIIIINDIFSLKKEIATDCIINAVPILYREGKSLDKVVARLTADMDASRDRLDSAAHTLLKIVTQKDPGSVFNVQRFVDGCRRMDTGTLEYSVLADRYSMHQYLQPDGTFEITL